ncbi:MAG TPA: AEC family transporter [Firmicutes bacterium]|jgi:malate permease and related proteins|nr:AEC family transporter [Bacillota bacterium]
MDQKIITQVLVLFLIVTVGYSSRKRGILNPALNKGLTELLLNVAVPFLVVSSFQLSFSQEMLANMGFVLTFSIVAHLLAILLGKFLFSGMHGDTGRILRFSSIFNNCGFMGYPIIGNMFGQQGVFYASIYNITTTIFLWTYGAFIFTDKVDRHFLTKAFINSGMVATFLGMLFFLFSVKLPLPLAQTSQIIGSMSTPISMIIIGSTLAEVKPLELFFSWKLYYGALVRLLLIPVLVLLCLKWFNLQKALLEVCVLIVAMPAPTMSVLFAEQNKGDVLFASRLVFFSTILSIFTIPFVSWMF